jgi:hypothetical protein
MPAASQTPSPAQCLENFVELRWSLRVLESRKPIVNICCGNVESVGRAGVFECARDLFHLADESPGFRSVGLDALEHLFGIRGIFGSPSIEQGFANV